MNGRPGESLPPADFAAAAATVEKLLGREADRARSRLLLAVSAGVPDFVTHMAQYSDVSMLPTPFFLYGQQPGEELTIDIEPGKTLIIKLLTVGEPHPDGTRALCSSSSTASRAAFRCVDKSLKGEVVRRPKANPERSQANRRADARAWWSPCPIKAGDKVKEGQKLLSLEAMKMETTLYADNDCRIADVLVKPGTPVEAGELVVQLE